MGVVAGMWLFLVLGFCFGVCNTVFTSSTLSPPPSSVACVTAASSGNISGEITLTMIYTAPMEHTAEWLFHYKTKRLHSVRRTAGTIIHIHDNTYSSTVTVPYNDLRLVIMRLYGGHDTLSAYIYARSIASFVVTTIPQMIAPVLDMRFSYVASTDRDLNLTFAVNHGVGLYRAMYMYTGLNTRGKTSKVFTKYHFNAEAMGYTFYPDTNGTSILVITIKQPYAALGGYLTIRLESPQWMRSVGILAGMTSGYVVKILPAGRDTIVPENTVGLSSLEKITNTVALQQSLDCTAIGNPQPNVQIFKETTNGSLAEVSMEYFIFPERRMTVATHLLDATERQIVGKYVCRAESGTAFAETRTNVLMHIDDTDQGK